MSRRTETELWEIAQRTLTEKQLKVMRYWLDGHSFRNIGITMNISESTARGHLDRAFRRMKPHLRKDAA